MDGPGVSGKSWIKDRCIGESWDGISVSREESWVGTERQYRGYHGAGVVCQ